MSSVRHILGQHINTPQTSTALVAAQEAYKIGDRLKEGKL